jgi:hypothetical protein
MASSMLSRDALDSFESDPRLVVSAHMTSPNDFSRHRQQMGCLLTGICRHGGSCSPVELPGVFLGHQSSRLVSPAQSCRCGFGTKRTHRRCNQDESPVPTSSWISSIVSNCANSGCLTTCLAAATLNRVTRAVIKGGWFRALAISYFVIHDFHSIHGSSDDASGVYATPISSAAELPKVDPAIDLERVSRGWNYRLLSWTRNMQRQSICRQCRAVGRLRVGNGGFSEAPMVGNVHCVPYWSSLRSDSTCLFRDGSGAIVPRWLIRSMEVSAHANASM